MEALDRSKVEQEEQVVLVSIAYLIGRPKYNRCGKYSTSACLECPISFFTVDIVELLFRESPRAITMLGAEAVCRPPAWARGS